MQRTHRTLLACALAFPLLLKSPSAIAQAADPSTTAADYRKAYAAMAKEDWPKARELLLKVWNDKNTYDVAASLGQVEFKLEHHAAAARYMAFALANVAPSEKAEFIERLKKGLREVRLRVGSIRVAVNEPGAEIVAGDEVIGTSPLTQEVFLDPGRHVVIARKGERSAKADVLAKAGEGFEVTLSLPAEPPPAAPTSGLGVASPPSAGNAEAQPGDTGTTQRSVVPVLVGGGVAVVAVGLGIGFRVAAGSSQDRFEELRTKYGEEGCAGSASDSSDCAALADAVDSTDFRRNFSTASFVVAGAAAIGTAVYWFWPRSTDSAQAGRARSFRFNASADQDGGMVWVGGSF
ncbi:MAG TPA: hypothetical protein VJN18_20980 [Polyangiaceae bacterium]|nr:hypothetical protein [Polyangiaceae bacterium]